MARDFFDELSDTITKTTKDLSKKAGRLYETQKIRSKIASEEQMIEKLKADIGNVIYERYKDGADTEEGLKGFCEEIQQRMQIIAGYRDAAANLKGQKICPACGKSVDRSVAFCPFCGSPCPIPEPAEEENAAETDGTQMETVCEEAVESENTEETSAVEAPENEDALNLQEKEDAVENASEETVAAEAEKETVAAEEEKSVSDAE